MKSMKKIVTMTVLAGLGAALVGGCGEKKKEPFVYRPSASNPEVSNPPPIGDAKPLAKMRHDDVIVWVDGDALTLRDFIGQDNFARLQLQKQPKDDKNRKRLQAAYNSMCHAIIPEFVNDRLLVHEARRQKLIAEADLEKTFEDARKDFVGAFGEPSWKALTRRFPDGERVLGGVIETAIWKKAMLATIKPIEEITPAVASNVIDQVKEMNRQIAVTNEMNRAKLKALLPQLRKPGADFNAVAKTWSQCKFRDDEAKGNWGAFGRSEFKEEYMNAEMGEAIFALKPGEISDVLEDGEGYSIVKFVEFDERDKDQPENKRDRILSRIFLPKTPPFMIESVAAMTKGLQGQMMQQAVDKRLAELKAQAKIVYPHGEDFFGNKPSYQQLEDARRADRMARKAGKEAAKRAKAKGLDPKTGRPKKDVKKDKKDAKGKTK